ncbi:MAG TPA: ATP-binding protein [Polyangia bacterium]|nr:ATP-binding protein [Polyangia bacterium]
MFADRGQNGSRAGYESARLALARLRLSGAEARATAVRQIAETGARALEVTRASVWRTSAAAEGSARCEHVFELGEAAPAGVTAVEELRVPAFLGALAARRVLSIPDVAADPRAVDLRGRGMRGSPLRSLLAAPVIRGGATQGFVCFEQMETSRAWTQGERDFAASVADMMALFLEQAERLEIEASLHARRELELEGEKMTALAQLARFVGHDIRNVLGALDLIGTTLEGDADGEVVQQGAAVRRAVRMGARIAEQLALFAGGEAVPRETLDLGALVREAAPMLARLVGGARLELDLAVEAAVTLPSSELQQVLLNLCVNAGEAVAERGLVRIGLRDPSADEPLSPTTVVLTVSDDGQGMDTDTQAHMFEPYFSRKRPGRGLGLAIVYGVVERAGGTILVESTPGRGTTFKIALPRSFDPPPRPPERR